ncbi:MAG TPA: GNAT family N-acetyltransferase [Polyangia bacterium]|nr:GNAT family N-acetyltransferase [Polyangia bacterium]
MDVDLDSAELRIYERMADLPSAAWDGLLDAAATPFVRWAWLEALEHAGCVAPARGWQPCHLTLWRGGRLCAAAPAYVKNGSDGDFSRDWGWAEAIERAGYRYYPKLVVGVPFTPVTGRRILAAPGEDRKAAVRALLAGARALAAEAGLSSVHVLFPHGAEAEELEAAGMARRIDFQWHWLNHGWHDPAEWLKSLNAKRRHQARREKAAPAARGITIRTVRGDEIRAQAAEWARTVHRFYRANVDKLYWGRRYLNQAFFERVFAHMPEHLEVVAAERAGRLIAGAFNVSSATHLYGRYWGCHEEHPFLHFNVCLYHSIDDCVERGIRVFEGGAGGEHKESRGFELAPTHSTHMFLDPRLDQAMRGVLGAELSARGEAHRSWRETRRSAR